MKIAEFIDEDMVVEELRGRSKEEVIEELSRVVADHEKGVDQKEMVKVLLDRESLGSTGIGEGVAIPHGKMKNLSRVLTCFARSKKGVDFGSIDGQPAYLFFLLVAPENSAGVHLRALARLSRMMKNEDFRRRLIEARDHKEIYKIILEVDNKLS
jgi:PTS system nitrogen regulatory IIA component